MSDDELLAFVADYQAEHGYPPSVREIGEACGYRSTSSTHARLAKLLRDGRITRVPGQPRTLVVVR